MSIPVANAFDFGQFATLRAGAKDNDAAAIQQTAQQFEGLFTQMLLKSMREGLPGDSLLGEQGEFYQSMFDQQLSTTLSSGKGLGLADLLVQQLKSRESGIGNREPLQPQASASGELSPFPIPGSRFPSATNGSFDNAQDFISAIKPHAERAAQELGVPARAIIAQAALETGWGQHLPRHADGRASYNLFGIKAGSQWQGETLTQSTQEFSKGSFGSEQAAFRSYDSLESAFDDYVSFLKANPRYVDALRADDVQGFAQGLQKAGYATDPGYAQKLVRTAYGRNMRAGYDAAAGEIDA